MAGLTIGQGLPAELGDAARYRRKRRSAARRVVRCEPCRTVCKIGVVGQSLENGSAFRAVGAGHKSVDGVTQEAQRFIVVLLHARNRERSPVFFHGRLLGKAQAGIDISQGVRPSSRLDPLGIELNAGKIYKAQDGWTLDEARAVREKDKAALYGKEGKPSEINHGNVTPSLKNDKGQAHHGGVTMSHARQSVVLSLPALRRLHFPDAAGVIDAERDTLGLSWRLTLSALMP